mmetsp:Transcript_925/g.2880  ORF Transcript_925/g.2880 Transcript_925/m.2880 type:complete len:257 (+) Transcript_925:1180-1950(+)
MNCSSSTAGPKAKISEAMLRGGGLLVSAYAHAISLSRSTAGDPPSGTDTRSSGCSSTTLNNRTARRRACSMVLAEEMSEPKSNGPDSALSRFSSVWALMPPARGGSFLPGGGGGGGSSSSAACRPTVGAGLSSDVPESPSDAGLAAETVWLDLAGSSGGGGRTAGLTGRAAGASDGTGGGGASAGGAAGADPVLSTMAEGASSMRFETERFEDGRDGRDVEEPVPCFIQARIGEEWRRATSSGATAKRRASVAAVA